MNIFLLDEDPALAAKYHNDKHVVKMILESAQMLHAAWRMFPPSEDILQDENLYRLTHKNHPCTVWARATLENWKWLYELMTHLNNEYKERYAHSVSHLSFRKTEALLGNYSYPILPSGDRTPWALAMPDEYKKPNAVEAYRQYYMAEKDHIASWKNGKPSWYTK